MLFNAYKAFNYRADHYAYVIQTSADGTVQVPVYVSIPTEIRCQISTTLTGDIVILADNKLQINALLKNIRDRKGNQVYPDGVWQIKQTQPLVNALGLIEGYRYKAKIIDGND